MSVAPPGYQYFRGNLYPLYPQSPSASSGQLTNSLQTYQSLYGRDPPPGSDIAIAYNLYPAPPPPIPPTTLGFKSGGPGLPAVDPNFINLPTVPTISDKIQIAFPKISLTTVAMIGIGVLALGYVLVKRR